MKITTLQPITREAKYLLLDVAVRYDDEDMAFDAPLRDGNRWKAKIDLDAKKIVDWPESKTLSFNMKITDEGIYILQDSDGVEIERIEGYVPNSLLPGDYGDYLDLEIDENGEITNWLEDANLDDF